jgi:two-component system sensor histidine kinase BaeS
VDDLLRQVATAHLVGAEAAGVTLRISSEGRPETLADPARLRQAVGNLLSNAIRHTPATGQVWLRSRTESSGTDGHEVVIDVIDSGTGIRPEDLPRVFDRFWRAEKSRSRETGGSGLGLAIVRRLAEAHDGTVSAANLPGRSGTVFTIRLPGSSPAGSLRDQAGLLG